MKTYSLLAGAMLLLLGGCQSAPAQTAAKPAYMQIFYEGANWMAGRPLLHYSPAFQGKSDELVSEPDSTKRLSPGALLFDEPSGQGVATTATSVQAVSGSNGQQTNYVQGSDGEMRAQTPADLRQERAREKANFNRQLNLLAARNTLARTTLTNALNTAAAEGWEVVQLGRWGEKDGLVYLLRRQQ
jgi:hypothetical protein